LTDAAGEGLGVGIAGELGQGAGLRLEARDLEAEPLVLAQQLLRELLGLEEDAEEFLFALAGIVAAGHGKRPPRADSIATSLRLHGVDLALQERVLEGDPGLVHEGV